MKYKVGDKVRFVKDCALGTGEVIPVNSIWIVREARDSHYILERTDEHLVAMIGHKTADDSCERVNTAPSVTKRITNKHHILNGLLNSDGSVDGEKLMEKLSNQSNDSNDSNAMAKGSHYEKSAMQPLEVSQALLTKEQFEGALLFNIIKYRMRKKGQDEADAYKARQYAYWLEMAREGRIINPSKDKVPFDYKFSII
jgi:hypothetical protein